MLRTGKEKYEFASLCEVQLLLITVIENGLIVPHYCSSSHSTLNNCCWTEALPSIVRSENILLRAACKRHPGFLPSQTGLPETSGCWWRFSILLPIHCTSCDKQETGRVTKSHMESWERLYSPHVSWNVSLGKSKLRLRACPQARFTTCPGWEPSWKKHQGLQSKSETVALR